jgi:hypothetical protein
MLGSGSACSIAALVRMDILRVCQPSEAFGLPQDEDVLLATADVKVFRNTLDLILRKRVALSRRMGRLP